MEIKDTQPMRDYFDNHIIFGEETVSIIKKRIHENVSEICKKMADEMFITLRSDGRVALIMEQVVIDTSLNHLLDEQLESICNGDGIYGSEVKELSAVFRSLADKIDGLKTDD